MNISRNQFESLSDRLEIFNSSVNQNIRDLNTTITVVARDLGIVKGHVDIIREQMAEQRNDIKDLNGKQLVSDSTMRKITSLKELKEDSLSSSFKKHFPKKLIIYIAIGLIMALGFTGYLIFEKYLSAKVMSNLPL